ncbi:MAG: hypothetical protein A2622_00445 [Bdellovibrionales bacterium RIFCSPHIGHO2_01_FULL_40_29]|nr:MAG: hypothetical protein A2622_00445 [Bdellovibrionales bacterium RIFCSPHIGHO2_01_FULL_40_29]OFZ32593.1 MAG: hypothetical protein A3D17_05045 [Bdellovibrionales bacterium RIFCSPHIGHO2_02_FULL_40_15]
MKKMTTILGLVIISCTTFAAEVALENERSFLCTAVEKVLEINTLDAALDTKTCLTESEINSTLVTEGIRTVEGKLTFNSPERSSFTLNCSASYYGDAQLENIIGGIESVTCEAE